MNHLQPLPVNNLNVYDFYEYGKPVTFPGMDYRTSTARGHRYYLAKDVPRETKVAKNVSSVGLAPEAIKNISETAEQFPFKFPLKYEPRATDRTFQSNRPEFIKYFDEKVRKILPKPINEYQTSYFHHYPPKELPEEPKFVDPILEKPIERPSFVNCTNQKGDAKYLDPYISTTHLDHIHFTEDMQNGIGKKDAITFWDWLQYPKTKLGFGLKEYPVKECKRILSMYDKSKFLNAIQDRELPKRMKFVPNNSFQTETRQNYQIPVVKPFIYDVAHGKAVIKDTGIEVKDTEYNVIGSGKRVQSYIEADKPKILHYKVPGDYR